MYCASASVVLFFDITASKGLMRHHYPALDGVLIVFADGFKLFYSQFVFGIFDRSHQPKDV